MALSTGPDIAQLIADTEAEISRVLARTDPVTAGVYEMCRYHLGLDGSGPSGKRIRPLLGLLSYASITGEHERALPGAAAVELGHNFSLVHDDIEDGDRERRHRPALWARYGIPHAINTGDLLFSLSRVAIHRLTDLGFPDHTVLRLIRMYDETCVALCEGQYLDIWMSEHADALSVDLYFDMIGRKTAALIAGSIEAGAILATADDEVIARYRAFGWDLGIAFQLNDDLLGIWGRETATGKEPTDLARKKKTLPVIYAFEHANAATRARLSELYASEQPGEPEVDGILRILEDVGAREYTRAQAALHRDRALTELAAANVVQHAARERLEEIVRSVISA
ncbi:MAG TPA: polyprenyl synthetase family protein [Candidatus Limnocylindrales bacterium]|nr:polyprenyl synthetase family protein [Candidatus Limnocylindrales bacterium]